SMTVSKKPLRSSAEQALASAAHIPTNDMLTASSVNNLFSRVPSLSATGTERGSNSFATPGRDRSDANQWANAIGWDVLTRRRGGRLGSFNENRYGGRLRHFNWSRNGG